ncbi:MAG TPA: helix-turn-helix domain-containing protein [Sporosarcina psychrophila]|uniref:Helix-turn-helix domain-containing protein n=1 Tax=Sporosarcina psychrophila TaxID=1476 RepID=A0A921KF31_SPOPS|nr:helix-turn-helix domain-containing protein [Sporosarcina psychrophila]
MSKKYSYNFKLKVVQEYLNGPLGYTLLSKKYNISYKSEIQKWVNQYKMNGKEGLQIKKTKKKYPLNFKLNVLRFKQDTGASYKETANAFGISEPSIIANWKSKYLKDGAEGLNKPQGRPPKMPKPDKNQKKTEEKNEKNNQVTHEIELLKKENEYLRIELEYLKKLKALGLKDPRANNKSK